MRLPFDSARLVSPFGMRTIFGKRAFHYGIDFVTQNKRIYACAAGKVIVARLNGGYGNNIMIQHKDLISVYGHLSEILVKEGQMVQEGDLIGIEGNTGRSTGSHLHFEFRKSRWERSTDTNPARVIGFAEERSKLYTYQAPITKPNYVKILEQKVDRPDIWVGFVEEMKNHPTGKWIPDLIEKLSK